MTSKTTIGIVRAHPEHHFLSFFMSSSWLYNVIIWFGSHSSVCALSFLTLNRVAKWVYFFEHSFIYFLPCTSFIDHNSFLHKSTIFANLENCSTVMKNDLLFFLPYEGEVCDWVHQENSFYCWHCTDCLCCCKKHNNMVRTDKTTLIL